MDIPFLPLCHYLEIFACHFSPSMAHDSTSPYVCRGNSHPKVITRAMSLGSASLRHGIL
ncbi:atp-dependent rna helicase prp43 [Moniliophthora roreri]|nr:atp-dependent rna helicase prp43 [Moniliophthora roreri]